ncbi:MAG TPA: PH domain-containing protein [Jatrophihabitans sp.]|nr:PH domain-containing protein [Jatrophihabitans sp.]
MPALLPSELPVRARTRHHWIVLLRPPHKLLALALLVLLIAAIVAPNPMAWLLVLLLVGLAFLRWQTWRADWVILTGRRIMRIQGVPETTTSEASLRLDRISGARLVQSVPGKILNYGTIELEAPGDHPDVRRLKRIARPRRFYLALRQAVFGEQHGLDPDDDPNGYITEPLPPVPPPHRFAGRHRWRDS